MATSRDDFIIAIRSAFLKKSTKQKFSLLTLVFVAILIITLSSLNFKIVKIIKSGISEIVYRSAFVISLPENFIKSSYFGLKKYSNFYNDFTNNELELEKLKSSIISNEIVISENKELKELIEDYTVTTNKILAKVIVDKSSPFLKTIIINKGSTDRIKIGTNIFDTNYLVGRVIEVNFKSSRVLLLSDLNSSIPVSIVPGNIQAIIIGNGGNLGQIKYTKDNLFIDIKEESIAYTSGTGSIFKSGIPVGKLNIINEDILIEFYSDFSQLKYVFAEVDQQDDSNTQSPSSVDKENKVITQTNTEIIKQNILNKEIKILNQSNVKLIDENNYLKIQKNNSSNKILDLQKKINRQAEKIDQNSINQKELEFLRMNLIYSSKCQKTMFRAGYKVGTEEYKNCIIRKGKRND
jgi:rod shape-determining protein MreC